MLCTPEIGCVRKLVLVVVCVTLLMDSDATNACWLLRSMLTVDAERCGAVRTAVRAQEHARNGLRRREICLRLSEQWRALRDISGEFRFQLAYCTSAQVF